MKLLFLLPSVPEPPTSGARIRNEGLLRLAAQHHQVSALAFGQPGAQTPLADVAQRFELVSGPPRRSSLRRVAGLAEARIPDLVDRYRSPTFASRLRAWLAAERFDAVQAEGLEMAAYLDLAPPGTARIYDAHNAEFLLQRRAFTDAVAERRWPAALYSLAQWQQLARFEQRVVRTSQRTLVVSQHDANQLEALAGGTPPISVLPNGIWTDRYPFELPSDTSDPEPNLLFLGTLGFRPNVEAIRWLLEAVLPLVHARCPRARLFVVGAEPPDWLVRLGQHDNRVVVTGLVADERPYLRRAQAMLLPLRVGGGSRLKALVAFASGLPVVSTRLGVEGLSLRPDADALVADEPAAFAEHVLGLLTNVEQRRALARSARALVEQQYDWSRLAPRLAAGYAGLG